MDDELVLLTSYFNLADGRRLEPADTFRVDPAQLQGETDGGQSALYVVTEASTGGYMGPRARRQVVETVAWEYNARAETPPGPRLKSALRKAHTDVLNEFEGHALVGLSILAVEDDAVFLGQVPPAQVYVVHDQSLNSMSARSDGQSPFSRSVGSEVGPKVAVFKDEIGPGDVVALCSSWFQQGLDPETLRECFGAGGAEEIAGALLDAAEQHGVRDATVIVIEAVLASELEKERNGERPLTFAEHLDMAVQALASVGRMILDELKPLPAPAEATQKPNMGREGAFGAEVLDGGTEVAASESGLGTPPDAGPRASAATAVEERPEHAGGGRDQATEEIPIVANGSGHDEQLRDELVERASDRSPATSATDTMIETAPRPRETKPEAPVDKASELEQVNSRLQTSPDMADIVPPVQAFPDTSTEPERIYATNKDIRAVNRRQRRFGGVARPTGRGGVPGPPVIRPGMADLDFRRPTTASAPPAVIWGGAAIMLVLALVAGYVWYKHRHPTVVVNPYPKLVTKDISLALAAKDPATQDAYLAKANSNLALAAKNGASARIVHRLTVQLQTTSDTIHRITRVTAPTLLSDFAKYPNAQPAQIAAGPDIIYVLDAGRKSVFALVPNATGNPTLVAQTGNQYSGFNLGTLQQLAISDTTALALDDQNVLVRSTAGTTTATSLTQQVQTPEKIVGMATAGPDVYLLDTANNQVWRFANAVDGFSPVAQAYFDTVKPNLTHSVSLALDDNNLYILNPDGTVQKFDFTEKPQPFTTNLKTPLQHPVEIYTAKGLKYVWIADPANKRIVQFGKSGTYDRTYSGSVLSQIKSFTVGPAGNTIYVLSGGKLYDFSTQP